MVLRDLDRSEVPVRRGYHHQMVQAGPPLSGKNAPGQDLGGRSDPAIAQSAAVDRNATRMDLQPFTGKPDDRFEDRLLAPGKTNQDDIASCRQPESVSRPIDQHEIAIEKRGEIRRAGYPISPSHHGQSQQAQACQDDEQVLPPDHSSSPVAARPPSCLESLDPVVGYGVKLRIGRAVVPGRCGSRTR